MTEDTKPRPLLDQPWKDECDGFMLATYRIKPKSFIVDEAGSVGLVFDYPGCELLAVFSADEWRTLIDQVAKTKVAP